MTETVEQPVLTTGRLRLRPLSAEDAAHITLYASAWDVARMTRHIPHPLPPGASEAFIRSVLSGEARETVWAIEVIGDLEGALIGVIGLQDDGEIGYWIGAPFWDTGFATEALQAVVAEARRLGHLRLRAEVFQDNPASARVLSKAGFRYLGEAESFSTARAAIAPVWTYDMDLAG